MKTTMHAYLLGEIQLGSINPISKKVNMGCRFSYIIHLTRAIKKIMKG